MANFVLIINGADFSDCITQREGIEETPTYINGKNEGVSKVGTPIFDRVRTTYAYTHKIKPLPRARYAALAKACEPNEVVVTVTSFEGNGTKTGRAQLSLSPIKYATDYGPTRIYHGSELSITWAD